MFKLIKSNRHYMPCVYTCILGTGVNMCHRCPTSGIPSQSPVAVFEVLGFQ